MNTSNPTPKGVQHSHLLNSTLKYVHRVFKTISLGALVLFANGCDQWFFDHSLIAQQNQKTSLKVLALSSPMAFQKLNEQSFGFDLELLQEFTKEHHMTYQLEVVNSFSELKKKFMTGEYHIAMGRLPLVVADISEKLDGPAYEETSVSLFCPRFTKNMQPAQNLVFTQKYFQPEFVQASKNVLGPDLKIIQAAEETLVKSFQNISSQKGTCLAAEDREGHSALRRFPSFEQKAQISSSLSLGWWLRQDQRDLKKVLDSWFLLANRRQIPLRTLARHQEHIPMLNFVDHITFLREYRNQFPLYEKLFKQAAARYKVPWELLAAVSYQESHWQKDAESFTGVKGMMMLTKDAAEDLGIEDRRDPVQSIMGGARYLRRLLLRQPSNIPYYERLSLALAAYNVGPSHLKDAQSLAVRLEKNPTSWTDMKSVLPLLADPIYYQVLPFGEARGHEPVEYVHRIKNYFEMLMILGQESSKAKRS
jgi:membrane-bound lytic murein transglycosylase F